MGRGKYLTHTYIRISLHTHARTHTYIHTYIHLHERTCLTPTRRFNGNTFEPSIKFELIGVLMGIAIFNRVILDLHFPMIAYGKILGRKPTLESLAEYMPVGYGWLVG